QICCSPRERRRKGSRGDICSQDSYTRIANRIRSTSKLNCKVAKSSSACKILAPRKRKSCRKLKKKPSRLIHPYNLENKRPQRCPTPPPRPPAYCRRPSKRRRSKTCKRKCSPRRRCTPSKSPCKKRSRSNCCSKVNCCCPKKDPCCPRKDSCCPKKDPCCPKTDSCCPRKDPCCPQKVPCRQRKESCSSRSRERQRSSCSEQANPCREQTSSCKVQTSCCKIRAKRSCSPKEKKQDCFDFSPTQDFGCDKMDACQPNKDFCCDGMDVFQPRKDFCNPSRNNEFAEISTKRGRRRVRDLEKQMRPRRQKVIICPCPDPCSVNSANLMPILCEKDSSYKKNKNHSKNSRKLWRKPKRIVMKSVNSNTSTCECPIKPSDGKTFNKPPPPPRPPHLPCRPSGDPPASVSYESTPKNHDSRKCDSKGKESCVKPKSSQKQLKQLDFTAEREFDHNLESCPKPEIGLPSEASLKPEHCPKYQLSPKPESYLKPKLCERSIVPNDTKQEKTGPRPNSEVLKLSNISNFIPNVSPRAQLKFQLCPDCHNLLPPSPCLDRFPKSVLVSRKPKSSAYGLDMKVRKRKQKPGSRKFFEFCNCVSNAADPRNSHSFTQTKCISLPQSQRLSKSPSPIRNQQSSFQERFEKAIRQYSEGSVNGCISKSSTRFGSSSTSALSLKNPRPLGAFKVGKTSVSVPHWCKDENFKLNIIGTKNVSDKVNDLCECIDKLVKNSKSCCEGLDSRRHSRSRSFDFRRNERSKNQVKRSSSLSESCNCGCPTICPDPNAHRGNSSSDPQKHCGSSCTNTKANSGSPCSDAKTSCRNSTLDPLPKAGCGNNACPEPKVRCGILFRCCHLITGCFITSNQTNFCKDGIFSTSFPVTHQGISAGSEKTTTVLPGTELPTSHCIKSRRSLLKMFAEN
ncbi:unnamed protein product, partial [Bemisia tabaci]